MPTLQEFSELVVNVCKRRHMYVSGGSFYEVCAYLQRFAAAMDPYPLGHDHRTSFNVFVNTRLGYPQKLAWPCVVKTATPTDEQAIDLLRDLLSEYTDALRNDRLSELIAETQAECEAHQENPSEPVICWRQFCHALHRADQDVLERLMLPHEHASVLWQSAYPDDVTPLMDQIAESYAIPVVSLSEDGSASEIMSPDFGILRLERIDGQWRIDAEPIIRCRLAVATETGKDA